MCGYTDEMEEVTDKCKEKVTSTNRRNNKPLMEKRRRQRINDCLNQLKSLVLQAMNKDTTQYSKLEKADILEMTVKHLKLIQRQQMTAAIATDPNVISKYRAGYNECAAEVARYLDTVNGGNPDLKSRLLGYLGNTMMQFPVIPVYQGVTSPYHMQISQMTNQHGFPTHYSQDSVRPTVTNPSGQTYSPPLEKSPHHGNMSTSLHSMHTSHSMSPTSRHVPSPSDSDSGLSDRSSPLSHDENGNYSVFNINRQFSNSHMLKSDHSSLFVPSKLTLDTSPAHSQIHSRNLKRKCDFTDDVTSVKRRNVCDTVTSSSVIRHAGPVQESDNMWRPW